MKKFLIAILLLIPLVIVMTLSLTGTVIMAATKVPVERLEIRDYLNDEFKYSKTIELELISSGIEVNIATFPGIAYDHSVEFKHLETSTGEMEIVPVDGKKKYLLTPKKQGIVNLMVSATSNIEAKQILNIYIKATELGELKIIYDNNRYEDGQTVEMKKSGQMYFNPYPIESIGNNFIKWKSEDEKIVKVDKNGYVDIIALGQTKITAEISDIKGLTHKISVNIDTKNAMIKTNSIYSARVMTVDEIIDKVLVNKTLDVQKLSDTSFKVTRSGEEEIITVNLTESDDIMFTDSLKNQIYTLNGGYHAEVVYKDINRKEKPNIELTSGDPSVVSIENGKLVINKTGNVTLKAKDIVTNKEIFKDIEVIERVLFFNLNMTQADNNRGIGNSRYYGYNWYDGNLDSYKHTFQLELNKESLVPKDAKTTIKWSVNNDSYATVDQSGLVTFKEESLGKSVTVYAHEYMHGQMTDIYSSYTFNMLEDKAATNVYSVEEFFHTANDLFAPVALQKDLMSEPNSAYDRYMIVDNDIYGNGFKYERRSNENNNQEIFMIADHGDGEYRSVKIENLIAYRQPPEAAKYTGEIVYFRGEKYAQNPEEMAKRPIIFKNCLFAYAERAMHLAPRGNGNITFEGCIVSNMTVGALVIEADDPQYSVINIKNSVFRECLGPGVMLSPPMKSGNLNVEAKGLPKINVDGFLDSYSWVKLDNLSSLLSMFDMSSIGNIELGGATINLGDALQKELTKLLKELFSQPELSHLLYDYKNEKYMNITMAIFLLWCDSDPNNFTDNTGDFSSYQFAFTKKTKLTLLGLPLSMNAIEKIVGQFVNDGNAINLRNNNYLVSYNFSNPRIKPDSVCPSNEALYKDLRDGRVKG